MDKCRTLAVRIEVARLPEAIQNCELDGDWGWRSRFDTAIQVPGTKLAVITVKIVGDYPYMYGRLLECLAPFAMTADHYMDADFVRKHGGY